MKNITFLLYTFIISVFLVGCAASYDVLPIMPEYPEVSEKFDTSSYIEYYGWSGDIKFNTYFLESLKERSYNNILIDRYYNKTPLKNVNIIAILNVKQNSYSCKDGKYIDSRVVVMVRRPGRISGKVFLYDTPRYFQAFSQIKVGNNEPEENIQKYYIAGKCNAVDNLFKITEFRQALEPYDGAPEINYTGVVNGEDMWKISEKFQKKNISQINSAIYWALNAIEYGNKSAEKYIDNMLNDMINIIDDGKMIFAVVKDLAEKGYPNSQNKLGIFYLNGIYCDSDNERAFEFFMKAAEQKLSVGIYNVGFCYESGVGVTADKQKALEYYKKAAELNYSSAIEKLQQLEE